MSNDKSKPFDLEAAKRGEPVECATGEGWELVRFIGEWNDEQVVCETRLGLAPVVIWKDGLRMAPKKVTVRYRVAIIKAVTSGELAPMTAKNDDEVNGIELLSQFVQWIHTDWQEAEIPQ